MPLYQPLRGDRAFAAVFRKGSREDGRLVTVRVHTNGLAASRLGFNIGRRLGGAVERNRIRRRLRHIVAQLDPQPGWDLVLIANPRTGSARYAELKSETQSLLRSAGVPLSGIDSPQ